MDPEPTQPSTQPLWNFLGTSKSTLPDTDDVICILSPATEPARKIVSSAARNSPSFILQNDLLPETANGVSGNFMQVDSRPSAQDGTSAPVKLYDGMVGVQDMPSDNLDLALRMTARVRDPNLGFVFGREPSKADIVLKTGSEDIRISGMHFRIYMNNNGILMIQDTSTNGTLVDGDLLPKPNRQQMLVHGTIIEVVTGAVKRTREMIKAKFIVALPFRPNPERYFTNLYRYLQGPNLHQNDHQQQNITAPPQNLAKHSSFDPQLFIAGTTRYAAGLDWNGDRKYNVIGEVGKGAFATVYKVATVSEGIVYAEKRLEKRAFVKNGMTDMKVNSELKIMKRLNHVRS